MPFQLRQIRIKLFLTDESDVDLDLLIPIFHEWIREKKIADSLLIDVADYRHVPNGPGVMLIADDAQYGLDGAGDEQGLLYSRRRDELRDAKTALREAVASAAAAAQYLEQDLRLQGKVTFRTDTIEMSVLDRAIAPNTAVTRYAVESVWREVLEEFSYRRVAFSVPEDPRSLFQLRIQSSQNAPPLSALCQSALLAYA